jgi:transketolase
VWTHDSIGLGEDGPTHQPIEHLAALRAIPGLDVVRPADANETAAAWHTILEHTDRPGGLILTRQNVPVLPRGTTASTPGRGTAAATCWLDESRATDADVLLIATGSEVQLARRGPVDPGRAGVSARGGLDAVRGVVRRPAAEYRDAVSRRR